MPGVWPRVLDIVETFCAAGVLRDETRTAIPGD